MAGRAVSPSLTVCMCVCLWWGLVMKEVVGGGGSCYSEAGWEGDQLDEQSPLVMETTLPLMLS